MSTKEIFKNADSITLPVPSGTVAGDPIAVGALVGICETSRDAAGNATVRRKGGHLVTTSDAVASVGLALYVTSSRTITTTASGNTLWGYSLATKGAGAGSLRAVIAQV